MPEGDCGAIAALCYPSADLRPGGVVTPGRGDREVLRALGLVTGIGAIFGVSVATGLGAGLLISKLVGGSVLAIAAGLLLGVLAGAYGVWRAVMRVIEEG